jgi:hypothetical protein
MGNNNFYFRQYLDVIFNYLGYVFYLFFVIIVNTLNIAYIKMIEFILIEDRVINGI